MSGRRDGNAVAARRAYEVPSLSLLKMAGMCWVSIWMALLGSDGAESSSLPAHSGSLSRARDQK